jgi:hypothetical protein
MCLTVEYCNKRDELIKEYSRNGHIEIFEFLNKFNIDIEALFELNILSRGDGLFSTAQYYKFFNTEISKNIIFYNSEYQIMLVSANKVDLLRQMAESCSSLINLGPSIAHEFSSSARINKDSAKIGMIDISDKIISVLNEDPFAEIDIIVDIKAVFSGGVTNKIRETINKNACDIKNFKHEWK